ncbi:hypothetical protein BDW74DRAFT_170379 [Aspergillus multicolor]|uniref:uncharacterized protein n=1 Tax=Aspergillus multicolor TaxID=41759 RepID=UPI003CCCBB1B
MGSTTQSAAPKEWVLNAFSMSSPTHVAPGLWRHPRNQTHRYKEINYWIELAKLLDGNFHALFIADMLGIYNVYNGPGNIREVLPGAAQFPISDQSLPIAAMAAVTKSLSYGVTASTTYESPFLLARRYATLDHLTNGRVAWNVVTSYLESAARNLGLEQAIPHDERYQIADEFLEVVYKLLEGSWRADAVVLDNDSKKYFNVAGPHLIEPSRQRTPFIFQAGASKAGESFATRHAEAMFLPEMHTESVKKSVQEIRVTALEQGRDLNGLKLIVGMLDEYLTYADFDGSLALSGDWTGADLGQYADDDNFEFTGPGAIQSVVSSWRATIPGSEGIKWTKKRVAQELALGGPHPRAIGSVKTVAYILEKWITETDVDGFNISYAVGPGDLEDVIRYLIPELKSRGDYLGMDFSREGRLSSDHPGAKYRWRADGTSIG